MVDALAALNALKNDWFFILAVGRDQDGDGFPEQFFGRIAEKAFRPLIPASDDAVEVFAEDRVVRRVNDGRKVMRNYVWPIPGRRPKKLKVLFWQLRQKDIPP
jgi:hypothetical protein